MAKGRTGDRARPLHVHVRLAHSYGGRSGDLETVPECVVRAGQDSGSDGRQERRGTRNFISAPSNCAKIPSPVAARNETALMCEVRPAVASVLRLQIGFRRRRIDRARDGAARREGGRSLRVAPHRRRPRPVDASRPDRINRKSGSPAPQAPARPAGAGDPDRSRRTRQEGGACLAVTSSAARAQSSASASGCSASATNAPPAISRHAARLVA